MNLRRGDIVLVQIPFHQSEGMKTRPAVVVLDCGDEDFVAAPITSRSRQGDLELALADWHAAGLNAPSFARIHKLAVLSKASVRRVIGNLAVTDLAHLQAVLCRAYCPSPG
jgi:mRNA-degrading endonuclease toxin of MazEF toxin-antitoxin module